MKEVLEADDYAFIAAVLREWGVIMTMHPSEDANWNGRKLDKRDVEELRLRGMRCARIANAIDASYSKEPI